MRSDHRTTHTRPQPQQTSLRLLSPDLARGLMLLFIAIANVSAYLWGRETVGISSHPTPESTADSVLSAIVILLIDGHVYPLFALLFGYGITQFAYSRIAAGIPAYDVGRMLLRRHLWLLAFGAVHAMLLFAGDILGAYALTGLALSALLLRGSDSLIRILLWVLGSVSVAFMVLPMLLTAVIGALLPAEFFASSVMDPANTAEELWGIADVMSGNDNYWLAMLLRLAIWLGTSIGAVVALLVPFMVLLGGYAARHRWLEATSRRFALKRVAIWGIAIGVIGSAPAAADYLGVLPQNILLSTSYAMLAQLSGLIGGLGYAALFGLIATRVNPTHPPGLVKAIAAVGKRSLSFYLLQSVVFAPLLAAWGLGLGGVITSTTAYLIALITWVLSLVLALWLEQRHRRGPAELLLRRLTYGKYWRG